MVAQLLRNRAWVLSDRKIQRLWQEEGLRVQRRHRNEYTRQCLEIWVTRRITALDVVRVEELLIEETGGPEHLTSDNNPEFIARAFGDWLGRTGIQALYITPGSPLLNESYETFNSRFQDEFLSSNEFT